MTEKLREQRRLACARYRQKKIDQGYVGKLIYVKKEEEKIIENNENKAWQNISLAIYYDYEVEDVKQVRRYGNAYIKYSTWSFRRKSK